MFFCEMTASIDISLIMAIGALVFTIFTFYYSNFRKGKLIAIKPNAIMLSKAGGHNLEEKNYPTSEEYVVAIKKESEKTPLAISLPITFINSGVKTYTVNWLKGRLTSLDDSSFEYNFLMQAELNELTPTPDHQSIATSIFVPAKSQLTKIIVFDSVETQVKLAEGKYCFELFAYINGKLSNKKAIMKFDFTIKDRWIKHIELFGIVVEYALYDDSTSRDLLF